jgi:mono/diheme cytochrome c family protein
MTAANLRRISLRLAGRLVAGCVAVAAAAPLVAPVAAQTAPAAAARTQVQRGEYLARAGDCISCHTASGGAPYAGGLRLDTPFGYMLSPNITPDPVTGIGRWSSADFYRAMHHGVNKRGQDMYPVMPYDFYTRVTPTDIDAIFAYLKTVKPVTNNVTVNHLYFPVNQRWSMGAWRELFFSEGTYKPDPSQSAAWNRGAYLVEGLGHCSDCHSPRDVMGGIEKSKQFQGAAIDGWFALNLSSNLHSGLGEWTADEIATYLKTGDFRGKTTALGPMAEVVKNSTSYMTDADLEAMGTYLKSIPASSPLRTARALPSDQRIAAASLYMDNCGGCHQAGGRGVPNVFPPLAGNGVVLSKNPADILKVVLGGVPARGKYVPMPSFANQLTDKGIADVANYVRSSWGNTAASDATPEEVARLRRSMKK